MHIVRDLPFHPPTLAGQVLMLLLQNPAWHTWGPSFYMPSVQGVLPVGTEPKAQQRYMRRLQGLGLVSGCDCGCRGDYQITGRGYEYLKSICTGWRNAEIRR